MSPDNQEWPIDRRSGEERRKPAVTHEPNGNTKWLMGIFAAVVIGAGLSWAATVNGAISKVAVLEVKVEFMSAEVSKLTRVIEQLRSDLEVDRERRRPK